MSQLHKALSRAAGYNRPFDPYRSQVTLMLKGEAAVDDSTFARTITTNQITYSTPGRYGNAAQYPDINGGVGQCQQTTTYDSSQQLGTGDFTIEGWLYKISHASAAGNQTFFQVGTTGANGLGIYLTTAGGIDFAGLNTYYCGVPSSTISLNTWYHIALVRSSGLAAIFVNGILSSRQNPALGEPWQWETCTSNFTQTNAYRIGGAYFSNRSIRGAIDEFAITKAARYLSNFTPPQRGLATQ
ncbi:LamG domain-containing protein [Phenylobacterium sp. SCN 70-31]|uniref:LamG domain-containing protein n=1 Tax=Phenylobacterium sp. SCN 70-31 TaxID=1660129 RepID=UPI0025EF2334|nr:LamG domain-containing protein [Phenylobacterium sp. SCN 70-31]